VLTGSSGPSDTRDSSSPGRTGTCHLADASSVATVPIRKECGTSNTRLPTLGRLQVGCDAIIRRGCLYIVREYHYHDSESRIVSTQNLKLDAHFPSTNTESDSDLSAGFKFPTGWGTSVVPLQLHWISVRTMLRPIPQELRAQSTRLSFHSGSREGLAYSRWPIHVGCLISVVALQASCNSPFPAGSLSILSSMNGVYSEGIVNICGQYGSVVAEMHLFWFA